MRVEIINAEGKDRLITLAEFMDTCEHCVDKM